MNNDLPSMAGADAGAVRLRQIRWMLGFFILGLVASGVTAFPLLREVEMLVEWKGAANATPGVGLDGWLLAVRDGLRDAHARYPWMAYGTDWLAFAHLVIAFFFVGPWLDPVRNVAALRAGVAACVAVVPLAAICGEIRGIPWGWRCIDASFGALGIVPLWLCLRWIKDMEPSRRSASGGPESRRAQAGEPDFR